MIFKNLGEVDGSDSSTNFELLEVRLFIQNSDQFRLFWIWFDIQQKKNVILIFTHNLNMDFLGSYFFENEPHSLNLKKSLSFFFDYRRI